MEFYRMRLRFSAIFFLTLVGTFWGTCAFARLSGSLEWDYAHYNAKQGGIEVADATSFAQRYTLLLQRQGAFMNGRGGRYDLALGGEWFGVNTNQEIFGANADVNLNRAKLLYTGDILFAPGGLPFRFHAYGRDMHRSRFQDDGFYSDGSFDQLYLSQPESSVLTPHIITDVIDGDHMEYGASMVLGIKNGSYLGRYRDLLSHFPKLYVDYRETHVDDAVSTTPEKYRDRELAFVSLNKKHNWFHYRFFEHKDYIDPTEDYAEHFYLLGTVDQNMRREWVNLTNWVQLSADGSYLMEENPRNIQGDENKYALNVFTKTQRSSWRSTMLSRFWRYEKPNDLERYLEVPVFADGDYDRDNSWRFQIIGRRELQIQTFALVSSQRKKDDIYSAGRWETNRTTSYITAPELAIESKYGDYGEGGAVRTGVEYYSNRNKRPVYDLFSGLSLAYFWGAPDTWMGPIVPKDTSLAELVGRFNLAKNMTARTRVGMESQLIIGSGTLDEQVTDYIRPTILATMAASQNSLTPQIDGTAFRGTGLFFVDNESVNRIRNRVEVGFDYFGADADTSTQFFLRHRLSQSKSNYSYDIKSEYLVGDGLSAGVTSNVFNVALTPSDFDGMSFSNGSLLTLTPNRNNTLAFSAWYDWRDSKVYGQGQRIALTQDYRYSRFVQAGLIRKLYELSQYLDYELMDPAGTAIFQAVALTGVADYFPANWLRLGTKVRWQRDLEVATDDIGFGLYSDIDFSLLNVGLEYEYGMRTVGDNGTPLDRDEQRWKISIKKTF